MYDLRSQATLYTTCAQWKEKPQKCEGPSLAPLELEPDDLPEVVLAAAADDAGLLLRGDGDGVAGRGALHRRGAHHVRVEQVLFGEWKGGMGKCKGSGWVLRLVSLVWTRSFIQVKDSQMI